MGSVCVLAPGATLVAPHPAPPPPGPVRASSVVLWRAVVSRCAVLSRTCVGWGRDPCLCVAGWGCAVCSPPPRLRVCVWGVSHPRQAWGTLPHGAGPGGGSASCRGTGCVSTREPGHEPVPVLLASGTGLWAMLGGSGGCWDPLDLCPPPTPCLGDQQCSPSPTTLPRAFLQAGGRSLHPGAPHRQAGGQHGPLQPPPPRSPALGAPKSHTGTPRGDAAVPGPAVPVL